MKPIYRNCFLNTSIILLLGTFHHAYTQNVNTDTLNWKISIPVTAADSATASYDSHLLTYGATKIIWQHTWIGKSGETELKTSAMTVTTVNGTWQNVNSDGELLYNVTLNNGTGTLKFKRSNGTYTLLMNLSGRNGGTTNREFAVLNVEQ